MWTIFGAGNLLYDIVDAIESNGEAVEQLVLNQKSTLTSKEFCFNIRTLKQYLAPKIASTFIEKRIFGFVDPNKLPFLTQIKRRPEHFNNLKHIRAWVCGTVGLGFGNYFAPNSTVASKANLEDFNYINRNASVGHHTEIGSYNHIGPGAIVCGNCKIGHANFLGAGSVIKDGISIANNITIGANATVVSDLTEKGIYLGTPARLV